ncbi:MAG: divalent-cation tolerance protein CutA, partial [Gammaproteobacteria bacterium]
ESLYRWEGSIQKDQEVLLLIKTTAVAFGEVESTISDLHPYELPEIIGVPVTQGSAPYLDWLTKSVG